MQTNHSYTSPLRFFRKYVCFVFLSIIFPVSAIAQEKFRTVLWGVDDGLSMDGKNYMLKDVNGFLWISSRSGINRFDGKKFEKYDQQKNRSGVMPKGFAAYPLIEDSLHNIWMGTNEGLLRFDIRSDTFSHFELYTDTFQGSRHCYPVLATANEVFVMHLNTKTIFSFNIHSLEKKILLKLESSDSLDTDDNTERSIVYIEKTKSLWITEGIRGKPGGGLLLISLQTGERQHFSWPCYKKIEKHQHLPLGMCFDRKRNCFWLNTKDGLIQFSLDEKKFQHIDVLDEWVALPDYNFVDVSGISLDQNNKLWVSTYPKGIYIYDPSTGTVDFPILDEKMQKEVSFTNFSIYCDRDGMVWTSFWGPKGIYQLIPFSSVVTRYDSRIFPSQIQNMLPAYNGKILLGGWSGLYSFDPGSGTFEMLKKGAVMGKGSNSNFPMMIDSLRQKAWIGVEPWGIEVLNITSLKLTPLGFKDIHHQSFVPENISSANVRPFQNGFLFVIQNRGIFYVNKDSLVAQQVLEISQGIYSFVLTDDKSLFLYCSGRPEYLSYKFVNQKWEQTKSPLDSLRWANIFYNPTDKSYWVGGFEELYHLDSGFNSISTYTLKDGLPTHSFVNLTSDNAGNIWTASPLGYISRINSKTGQIITLTENEGHRKNHFDVTSLFIKDDRGDLYFSGAEGIDRVSPAKLNSAPPSAAYIMSIEVNQNQYFLPFPFDNAQELSLEYFQNNINIETGIIDHYSNGNGRIRYKIEGLNNHWQYVPNYYTIRLDGLQPDKYRLVMQASNSTNEFIGPEKILMINIRPPFWQTTWFRISIILIFLLLLYGLYKLRTAALHKQKRVLEHTVKVRTAEVMEEKVLVEKQKNIIQSEKDKSDKLLLNILPSEVAEELKEKGYTTARSFDDVTVLFSDIKGFTHVAETMTAQELVKEIDTYFSAFDQIMQDFGLEKIKTIGDAYIAAGGLAEKNEAIAGNVVGAAIAMQQKVELLKQERESHNKPFFELRIGIHTGPVVAGVVGIKKFQYDIWGDTVNLAARMEQSGVAGKINISQQTYDTIKGSFNCIHRGKIDAKNKGSIDMYFVEPGINTSL